MSDTFRRVTVLATFLIGFRLRLVNLGRESLWYDEIVSVFLAQKAPLELIARTAGDIHPARLLPPTITMGSA